MSESTQFDLKSAQIIYN